jgi:MinD-like ATPase involved in chromosome partitioning or flagellar assembly
VTHQISDDWKAVSGAINMGVPLIQHAPRSKARLQIRELAEKLISPEAEMEQDLGEGKGGLFSRIFSGAD